MQMLGMFAPAQNPKDAIERMLRIDIEAHTYANLLNSWATRLLARISGN